MAQQSDFEALVDAIVKNNMSNLAKLGNQAHTSYQPLNELLKFEPKKERQYFLNQTVLLDGIEFIECRFDKCILKTMTGEIKMKDCVIDPSTQLQLGPKLLPIVKLLHIFKNFPLGWQPRYGQVGEVYTVSIP